MYKYMLAVTVSPNEEPDWKEVTLEEWRKAERAAGFINKGAGPTATAAFWGSWVMGQKLRADKETNDG